MSKPAAREDLGRVGDKHELGLRVQEAADHPGGECTRGLAYAENPSVQVRGLASAAQGLGFVALYGAGTATAKCVVAA
jgi:hypothetical protein